jgi:tRNA threonylcarbamoyladenosine biosynthesis protein TsaB
MFTGLRIGIATARALATAAGLPLRRVSSLAALAAGMDHLVRLPLIDARRGEVFAALYEGEREFWPPMVTSPEDLIEQLGNAAVTPLAAGDGSVRFRGMLEEAGIQVEPDDSVAHVVRALCVCRLGEEAQDESPEAVLPEYLREPDAKPQQ